MKKIKMLLDNGFDPDLRVYKEAKFLTEIGNEVEIVCLDRKNTYFNKPTEVYDGIKITRIFTRSEKTTKLIEKNFIIRKLKYFIYMHWLFKFAREAKKYLKNEDFEILHCHDLPMALCGVRYFKNKKVIFDMHEYYANKKSKLLNCLIDKVVKYVQKRATWIVHVNDFQVMNIKNREKLVYIPNYPEKAKFENFKRIESNDLRISYTGYVRHYGPLYSLMKAVSELENVKVSINGSGDAYEQLLQASKEMKNVVLTGKYSHEDIAKFYENSDLVYIVYNAKNKNDEMAFPTKFFEAIITCTPMVVSENTAMGDFVVSNNIGFVVDGTDYNSIKKVLKEIKENPMLLKEKYENLIKISNKYSWEEIVLNLEKVYK